MDLYEQKYNDAPERAKKLYGQGTITESLGFVFPELKESEDVMWRNWLIGHLVGYINQTNYKYAKVCKEAITWLKKQGESDETKAKRFLINKGYPIDTNGIFPTYEEMYNIIREGWISVEDELTATRSTGLLKDFYNNFSKNDKEYGRKGIE